MALNMGDYCYCGHPANRHNGWPLAESPCYDCKCKQYHLAHIDGREPNADTIESSGGLTNDS